MGSTSSEVFLTFLFWKCWNFFEESNLFVFLWFVWNSLPSFIPLRILSLSPPSLPFHPTPVPCQIWRLLKGNITVTKDLSSPRLIPYGGRWRGRLQLSCTPQGQCGNNPFCSSFPIPAMSSACQNQEFLLSWLHERSQPWFFHFFSSVSRTTEFRGLNSLQKHILSDPVPTEFMLQFTFELLPILTNSIVPFLSINYIWIVFLSSSLFIFQDGRNLISGCNYSSSTNLSFVSKITEQLSHWVLSLPTGFSECQRSVQEASSISHTPCIDRE